MRWFLCGWALSMLGNIVELIFSIVNFADQTQKLVIDLNSLEQKIVGEVPLEETDRVCFLRHPELPQVSAVEVASQLEFIFVPLVVAFGLVLLAIPLWYNIPWRVASKLWICIKEGTRAALGSPAGEELGDTEDPAQSQRSTALGSPPGDTEEGTEEPGDTEDREDGKGKGFKGDKGDGKGKKGEKGDGFGKSSGKGFDKGYGKDGKGKGKGKGLQVGPGDRGRLLYVGNLPSGIPWQKVKDLFKQYGNVIRVEMPTDMNGESKGHGNVLFETEDDAQRAIQELNQSDFEGRSIVVRLDNYV